MPTSNTLYFAFLGYLFAGMAFLALTLVVGFRKGDQYHGPSLLIATAASVVWGFANAGDALIGLTPYQIFLVDVLHDGFWLFFLAMLLKGTSNHAGIQAIRFSGLIVFTLIVIGGTIFELGAHESSLGLVSTKLQSYGLLITSMFSLVGIEQIYRNSRDMQRDGLKFLCIGLGAIFAYDLLIYSNWILSGVISERLWSARGFVVLACSPLIGIAVYRGPSWLGGLFLSRQVIYYATTTFFAIAYLGVIGVLGLILGAYDDSWGSTAQIVFFVVALLMLAIVLVSNQLRSWLRVHIAKNFFASKYDYRAEWLRLIDTLTAIEEDLKLRKRAIKALAQIVDAQSGFLWLHAQGIDEFECVAGWNIQRKQGTFDAGGSFATFLAETGWVIDFREYTQSPEKYDQLKIDVRSELYNDAIVAVPLLHDGDLLGVVFLSALRVSTTLIYEDHDLLRTAGKQIASYLAQERSTELLAEAKQFEAFNRLTAYLMHDLKNLVAQQSLIVENAQKHKGNPEFVDDAISTIQGGVNRLRKVIDQIQQRSSDGRSQRIDLGKLLRGVVSHCSGQKPAPEFLAVAHDVFVMADKDRLAMAVYHAIRNAQDATDPTGRVAVRLTADSTDCRIEVKDNGIGMDEDFIRDRLFRPFDSTKGTQGMGIGAYQMRETIRSMSGDVSVNSIPGGGTQVNFVLRKIA